MEYVLDNCHVEMVVMVPLEGLDLVTYNGDPQPHPHQQVIDQGLKLVNENIVTLNVAFNNSAQMLHQHIYKNKGHGKFKLFYCRLWDGLHDLDYTLERWGGGAVSAPLLLKHLFMAGNPCSTA